MSKRYGKVEVQMRTSDEMWLTAASIDGGRGDGDKWIKENGGDGDMYRVVRVYPSVVVALEVQTKRTLTPAEVSE
jgi:ribosomal protein L16/L10AE